MVSLLQGFDEGKVDDDEDDDDEDDDDDVDVGVGVVRGKWTALIFWFLGFFL